VNRFRSVPQSARSHSWSSCCSQSGGALQPDRDSQEPNLNLQRGLVMKPPISLFRISLVVFAVILLVAAPRASAQRQSATQAESSGAQSAAAQLPVVPARITQAIDETQLVTLKGNVHPLARPEFDRGAVPPGQPLQRMLVLLKRSPEQETDLAQFLLDQQNASSPNYRQWLTPEQFGTRFGPADADIQTVVSWLQFRGFQVAKVSKGKLAIEFSGTAAQLKEAFHTEIHKFAVRGEQHIANASEPQIPAALAPVVRGFAPIGNFRPKPMHRVVGEFTKSSATSEVKLARPEMTTTSGCGTTHTQPCYALGPTDFATIYNVLPLWNIAPPNTIDGTGVSIAIAGISNINLQDVADFRSLFGLSTGGAAVPNVTIDGADPGIVNGAETEALLDTEWSGAVAKGAQIHFVIAADTDASTGLLLAVFNVIDNNSDPILSLSFGNCEAALSANANAGFVSLWEQAAAQGITVTVSSGDNGSAGCEDQNANPPNPATTGLQVSGFASTPFNVAVGGTDFNDAQTQLTYFNAASNVGTLDSAKGYIPESTWNESCTNAAFGNNPETNCNAPANSGAVVTVGGSGGASTVSLKPAYQKFAGLPTPNDNARDLPDVSLFASGGFNNSFYVVCEADAVTAPSCKSGGVFHFLGIGGTSASAPSFAGIMALVNQKTGKRQGNANFVLYKLAQMQFQAATACASLPAPNLPNPACTFNDVTTGTIAMPCAKNSPNCNPTSGTDTIGVLSGYNAGTGYDLATGLGSVNANNLVNNWTTGVNAFTATTTTLSLNPTSGITAGQAVTVNVMVSGAGGTPTGAIALVSTAQTGEGVDGFILDSSGKVVSGATTQLTGGGPYSVTARYSGDGTFAPSVSAPIMVTVGKANSTTSAAVLTCPTLRTCAPFASGPSPVTLFLAASVSPTNVTNINGNPSPLTPTGKVTFSDNGTPIAAATNVVMDQSGEAFTASGISTFAAGNHSITAQYSGDPSFNTSNSSAVAFTISSSGSFAISGAAVTVTAGSSGMSSITVTPNGGFTGIVNVACGTAIPGVTCTPNPLAINITSASAVASNLSIAVAAPSTNLSASAAPLDRQTVYPAGLAPSSVGGNGWWMLSGATGLMAVLLFFVPGRRRLRHAMALGLALACLMSFALGCGGGYGGGGGGLTATITHLTVSSTKVAANASLTVSAAVTGGTPAGNVQFFADGAAIGSAVPVSGGTTGNITVTAAQAPALLQLIGTHTLSAHYLGDTYTSASQSGTLNITVTGGPTNLAITGTSGGTAVNGIVAVTIN